MRSFEVITLLHCFFAGWALRFYQALNPAWVVCKETGQLTKMHFEGFPKGFPAKVGGTKGRLLQQWTFAVLVSVHL